MLNIVILLLFKKKPLRSGKSLKKCKVCGNIGVKFPDKICNDPKRDKSVICVVEDISDLWALEKTGSFKGLYHVLGGSLSALDNITPDDLMIKENKTRWIDYIAFSEKAFDTALEFSNSLKKITPEGTIAKRNTRISTGLPISHERDPASPTSWEDKIEKDEKSKQRFFDNFLNNCVKIRHFRFAHSYTKQYSFFQLSFNATSRSYHKYAK